MASTQPSFMDHINVKEALAVGAVGGGLYYFLAESNIQSSLQIGGGIALASAVSDWLASMDSVQSALGNMLKTLLKPVLVGLVGVGMTMLSGGDVSSVDTFLPVFAFGAGAKFLGDYAYKLYEDSMTKPKDGGDNAVKLSSWRL